MDGLTFIDRMLGRWRPERKPSDEQNLRFVRESIRQNLEDILNTHRGQVRHLPDYGLPDLSLFELGSTDGHRRLAREIETLVRTFESRLDAVAVELTKVDPIRKRLELKIVGTTAIHAEKRRFLFRSIVEDPRGAQVQASDEAG